MSMTEDEFFSIFQPPVPAGDDTPPAVADVPDILTTPPSWLTQAVGIASGRFPSKLDNKYSIQPTTEAYPGGLAAATVIECTQLKIRTYAGGIGAGNYGAFTYLLRTAGVNDVDPATNLIGVGLPGQTDYNFSYLMTGLSVVCAAPVPATAWIVSVIMFNTHVPRSGYIAGYQFKQVFSATATLPNNNTDPNLDYLSFTDFYKTMPWAPPGWGFGIAVMNDFSANISGDAYVNATLLKVPAGFKPF